MKLDMKRAYGWQRDLPDQRDIPFIPTATHRTYPPSVSLRPGMPPVYDQGDLGSCTANALAAQLDYMRKKQREPFITPSRLFIYYNERYMEGTIASDSGAMIRDGIKTLKNQGACPESEWSYNINRFVTKPSIKCYNDAVKYESLAYKRVDHAALSHIKAALVDGLPVSFGFTVYESFEGMDVERTGIMPMPKPDEAVVGGHAVVIVGYDDARAAVEVRNSWGSSFGDHGYFWMPYAYVTGKLCSDFWTIISVT